MQPPKRVLTTGEMARICQVTKRTVINWLDSGQLPGYRVPGSRHRRIPYENVLSFMREHGIPAPDAAGGKTRLLIVDADPGFAGFVRSTLDPGRFEIRSAATAFEAAGELRAFEPDLVLVDVRLPDLDGFRVCAHIRADPRHRRTRILLVSAFADDADAGSLKESGAEGFLTKPVEVEALRRRMNALSQAS